MNKVLLYPLFFVISSLVFPLIAFALDPCCSVVSLDAKRLTVTAIERTSAKLLTFSRQAVLKGIKWVTVAPQMGLVCTN